MKRIPLIALIALALGITMALPAQGQEPPQNPPPQGGGPLPGLDNTDMRPGEIQRAMLV